VFVASEAKRLRVDVSVHTAPYELDEVTAVARAVLSADPRPTAAFCFSDSLAYGMYAASSELGLEIPRQLSLIGYDDHPMSALLTPPLTSFNWDSERLIDAAVGMVLAAIDGRRRRRRVVIEPALRERASTGRNQR
jgi:LacI family transcriptional regulator